MSETTFAASIFTTIQFPPGACGTCSNEGVGTYVFHVGGPCPYAHPTRCPYCPPCLHQPGLMAAEGHGIFGLDVVLDSSVPEDAFELRSDVDRVRVEL